MILIESVPIITSLVWGRVLYKLLLCKDASKIAQGYKYNTVCVLQSNQYDQKKINIKKRIKSRGHKTNEK